MSSLPPDWTCHFTAGVAHRIGGCAADGTPVIARALAADVLPHGQVLVLMSQKAGPDVLDALRETGQVALVMIQPQTLRTLQLKGRGAEVTRAHPSDRALLEARLAAVRPHLRPYGFREGMLQTWYTVSDDDLARVTFEVVGAWDQTPGPRSGQAVELVS